MFWVPDHTIGGLTPGHRPTQAPPDKVDFQKFLRESQIKALQAFGTSQKNSESGEINPFQSHFWILNNMTKNLNISANIGAGSFAQSKIDKAYGLQENLNVSATDSLKDEPTQNFDVQSLAKNTAKKYGIPESFFLKLIKSESNFNPQAESPKGAMGLGQLMPKTAEELGLRIDGDDAPGSVWHPESNLDASANYLDQLQKLYRSKGVDSEEVWKLAAGAYNAGMGNIQKAINKMPEDSALKWDNVAQVLPEVTGRSSQETIKYVDKIFA